MATFHLGISGDFLNEQGQDAYGGLPLDRLALPHIRWHFIRSQSPTPGDAAYWQRFYSLKVRREELAGLDGLILLRPWLKREALEGTSLVVVGRSGVGYDKVDVAALTDNDVALFNAPGALDHTTASTALLFLLALAKRIFPQDRITREGRWDLQAQEMGHEIAGRTLGIVGLGNSGRELARLVAPFGMTLLAYSPLAEPMQAAELGVTLTSLDDLLRRSDFVSIHARLRPENHRLIGARELSLMKPTAYVINVSRGEIVDQPALVEALQQQRIRGAALDVYTVEPLPPDDPLTKLDNVILTPHWSCSTHDVWQATGRMMVDGMLRAASGLIPENIVNRDVLERPGFREKLARFAKSEI